jgi:hypothetical protein
MDPRDFHSLALRLVSSASATAADCRTAVGRSYYAVFNVAADHLRRQGFRIGKGAAAHGEVQKCLSNSGEPVLATVASELNDLHTSRNRADYQLGPGDVENPAIARNVAAMAGRLIQYLDGSFGGVNSGSIYAAIQKWRRDNGYP